WAKVHDNWGSVGEGVERVYRRGRQALAAVRRKPTAEYLHEWRKQAKYLRYQLDLLRPLAPKALTSLATTIDRLGDLLGDDHDLAVLRREVAGDPARFGGAGGPAPLLALTHRPREGGCRRAGGGAPRGCWGGGAPWSLSLLASIAGGRS